MQLIVQPFAIVKACNTACLMIAAPYDTACLKLWRALCANQSQVFQCQGRVIAARRDVGTDVIAAAARLPAHSNRIRIDEGPILTAEPNTPVHAVPCQQVIGFPVILICLQSLACQRRVFFSFRQHDLGAPGNFNQRQGGFQFSIDTELCCMFQNALFLRTAGIILSTVDIFIPGANLGLAAAP